MSYYIPDSSSEGRSCWLLQPKYGVGGSSLKIKYTLVAVYVCPILNRVAITLPLGWAKFSDCDWWLEYVSVSYFECLYLWCKFHQVLLWLFFSSFDSDVGWYLLFIWRNTTFKKLVYNFLVKPNKDTHIHTIRIKNKVGNKSDVDEHLRDKSNRIVPLKYKSFRQD